MHYRFLLVATLLIGTMANGQEVQSSNLPDISFSYSVKNMITGTASVGFMNGYRKEYTVPAGFEKGNMTGFAPIYVRAEYGIAKMVTLGFSTSWSTIYFNSFKTDVGYNGPIRRYYPNKWRLFSGGLIAYYHFTDMIYAGAKVKAPKLDVFIGGGVNLNNISESARPQGDSIIVKQSHTATPTIKIGARYYVRGGTSVFADAGYDKLSLFSIGASHSFMPKRFRAKEAGKK